MKKLLFLTLIFPQTLIAAIVIHYDSSKTPNIILDYQLYAEGPLYQGLPNYLVFDDSNASSLAKWKAFQTLIQTVPQKYMKQVAGDIVEMTSSEKAAVDFNETVASTTAIRNDSLMLMNNFNSFPLMLRAITSIAMDEINVLRKRDRDRSADVASAISLADLKAKWALQSSLDDRTFSQLKTAILNRINDGSMDSQ